MKLHPLLYGACCCEYIGVGFVVISEKGCGTIERIHAHWKITEFPIQQPLGPWEPLSHECPQSVVLSGLGVILCDPIPWGPITTHEGYHVYWSEFKMFDATNSKLLCWDKLEGVWSLSRTRPSTVLRAWWLLSWKLYNFSMGMGYCFYPMTICNEVTGCWEIARFPTLPTSPLISTLVMGWTVSSCK